MIDRDDVKRIAELSKLHFEEEDLDRFVPTFRQILDYVGELQDVDTEAVEPTYHAGRTREEGTPLREDKVEESLPAEEALEQAPQMKENHFRVPKVIE